MCVVPPGENTGGRQFIPVQPRGFCVAISSEVGSGVLGLKKPHHYSRNVARALRDGGGRSEEPRFSHLSSTLELLATPDAPSSILPFSLCPTPVEVLSILSCCTKERRNWRRRDEDAWRWSNDGQRDRDRCWKPDGGRGLAILLPGSNTVAWR